MSGLCLKLHPVIYALVLGHCLDRIRPGVDESQCVVCLQVNCVPSL